MQPSTDPFRREPVQPITDAFRREPARPVTDTFQRAQARPGTGTVRRVAPADPFGQPPSAPSPRKPAPVPTASSSLQGWVLASLAATMVAGCIAVWALATAHATDRMLAEARAQRDKAVEESTALRAQNAGLEVRIAESQAQVVAERAATVREREVVTGLQRAVGRLSEELVRATKPLEPMLSLGAQAGVPAAPPGLPQPGALTAGVPVSGR
jgi:hypothetical protein